MSGTGRRGESFAQSLFPFLAVLLCTMGALVLMLMLLIAHAQSSAKEVAEKVEEEIQWEQEKLQLVKTSLSRKYEDSKLELEKKRLVLQNLEKHIEELTDELQQLEKTAQAAETNQDTRSEAEKIRDQQREALEKQLTDAKKSLETKLKDPKGDKPIFAIIPYEGPNGTHRRPIYLECSAKGVIIQPEGVAVSPADLRPPYGPGNPLDAVLRTIRAEYPATNGAITSNPYPLLVVRPSGIKNYMMARAAMSGWDDQFGYELISEDLELAFPPGTPNLDKKIVRAIETARERQAALVMAMPQHYDASQVDMYRSGSTGWDASDEDVSGEFESLGGGSGSSGSSSSRNSRGGSGRRGGMSLLAGGGNGNSANGNDSGGDRSFDGQASSTNNPNSSLAQRFAPGGAGNGGAGNGKGDAWTFQQSIDSAQDAAALRQAGNAMNGPGGGNGGSSGSNGFGNGGTGSGSMSFFGGGSSDDPRGISNGSGGGNGFASGSSGSNSSGSNGGYGSVASGDFGGGGGLNGGSGSSGSGGGQGNSGPGGNSGSSGNNGPAGNSSPGGNGGSANSSGNFAGGSAGSNSAGSASSGMLGSGGPSSQFPGGQSPGSSMGDPGALNNLSGSSMDPSQRSGEISGVGINYDKSRRSSDNNSSAPVSQSKGRGWAWRDGNRSKTAIVRAIWLQCYNDRWVIRPDRGSNGPSVTIKLEGSPVQQAEKLAQAVHQRVDLWGVAIAGGHWSPVLHVEVASDADARFQQLQRLMEGSGIEVIRKGTLAPNSR